MDLSDRSQSRQNPQDPLVLDTVGYVWTRAVNPILAAVMRDRDNRPDIWPQSLRSDYHSASCQQGAVHIWVLAPGRHRNVWRAALGVTSRNLRASWPGS